MLSFLLFLLEFVCSDKIAIDKCDNVMLKPIFVAINKCNVDNCNVKNNRTFRARVALRLSRNVTALTLGGTKTIAGQTTNLDIAGENKDLCAMANKYCPFVAGEALLLQVLIPMASEVNAVEAELIIKATDSDAKVGFCYKHKVNVVA